MICTIINIGAKQKYLLSLEHIFIFGAYIKQIFYNGDRKWAIAHGDNKYIDWIGGKGHWVFLKDH